MTFMEILTLMAGVMLGEAGVLGPEAALAVGHIVHNRVAAVEFPNTYAEVVEQGFYGWSSPTDEYIHLAYRVFIEEDPTDGCLFALSKQDRKSLGWGRGNVVFGTEEGYQLHLYHEWQGSPAPNSLKERIPIKGRRRGVFDTLADETHWATVECKDGSVYYDADITAKGREMQWLQSTN